MKHYPLIVVASDGDGSNETPTGLIEHNGRPWLERQVLRFTECHGAEKVVVVLGHRHLEYLRGFLWLNKARDAWLAHLGLHVMSVINPHPEAGQFSSLQCGAMALADETIDGAFVLPMDVPAAESEVWSRLQQELTAGISVCVPEWQGLSGYPLLLSSSFLSRLPLLPREPRLDTLVFGLPQAQVRRICVEDASVCMTINTPERWREYTSSELA